MKASEVKGVAGFAAFLLVIALLSANLFVQLQILARTPPTWGDLGLATSREEAKAIMDRVPLTRIRGVVAVEGDVRVDGGFITVDGTVASDGTQRVWVDNLNY